MYCATLLLSLGSCGLSIQQPQQMELLQMRTNYVINQIGKKKFWPLLRLIEYLFRISYSCVLIVLTQPMLKSFYRFVFQFRLKYLCVLLAVRARCNTISWQTCQPPKMDRHPRFSAKHKGEQREILVALLLRVTKYGQLQDRHPIIFQKLISSHKTYVGGLIYETMTESKRTNFNMYFIFLDPYTSLNSYYGIGATKQARVHFDELFHGDIECSASLPFLQKTPTSSPFFETGREKCLRKNLSL